MPYTQEHKARTRAKIVECARVMFNRRGFDSVSIDDVMREAGLTRGGFYNHSRSKDELYAEAVMSFGSCNPFAKELARLPARPDPTTLARMLVELYLSDEVLNDVTQHCPLVALPSDVARAGLKPRAAYTQVVRNMLHVFRVAFDDDDPEAENRAQIMLNLCVGGMVIARTTDDTDLRRSLRAAARAQALSLLPVAAPVPARVSG
ncbi:MAG TPA: TetR/AcrR family transcriptional regulator [Polyangiaceae bacterium]|jgi:AcrR family transcriptional regulator|nr:TetR/AcrR family transcriptional regulator [Polyangiaceae bacterium]